MPKANAGREIFTIRRVATSQPTDLQEKSGDAQPAALSYGQFLRRHAVPDEFAHACFLRREASVAKDLPNLLARASTLRHCSLRTLD